jgi:hypothetical protein
MIALAPVMLLASAFWLLMVADWCLQAEPGPIVPKQKPSPRPSPVRPGEGETVSASGPSWRALVAINPILRRVA